jgi:hypothetical protein
MEVHHILALVDFELSVASPDEMLNHGKFFLVESDIVAKCCPGDDISRKSIKEQWQDCNH